MIKNYFYNLLIYVYQFVSYLQLIIFKNKAIIVCESHGRNIFSLKNSSNKKLLSIAQPTKIINLIMFWINLTSYKFNKDDFQIWLLRKIKQYNVTHLIISSGEIDIRYYANLKGSENILKVADSFCYNIIDLLKKKKIKIIYITPPKPCLKLKDITSKGRIPFEGTYSERLRAHNDYLSRINFNLNKFKSIILLNPDVNCNRQQCDHDKDFIHLNSKKNNELLKKIKKFI